MALSINFGVGPELGSGVLMLSSSAECYSRISPENAGWLSSASITTLRGIELEKRSDPSPVGVMHATCNE